MSDKAPRVVKPGDHIEAGEQVGVEVVLRPRLDANAGFEITAPPFGRIHFGISDVPPKQIIIKDDVLTVVLADGDTFAMHFEDHTWSWMYMGKTDWRGRGT